MFSEALFEHVLSCDVFRLIALQFPVYQIFKHIIMISLQFPCFPCESVYKGNQAGALYLNFFFILEKGPWIIGEGMNGSYFIQAFIHVFKKMAHEKSFLEMMKEVTIQ